jgi:multicomponent Na+:H+ antiporter subunit G
MIIGVGIAEPTWIFKTGIIAMFILMTNPLSAHALARASLQSGVKLWEKSVVDKRQELVFQEPRTSAGGGEKES